MCTRARTSSRSTEEEKRREEVKKKEVKKTRRKRHMKKKRQMKKKRHMKNQKRKLKLGRTKDCKCSKAMPNIFHHHLFSHRRHRARDRTSRTRFPLCGTHDSDWFCHGPESRVQTQPRRRPHSLRHHSGPAHAQRLSGLGGHLPHLDSI